MDTKIKLDSQSSSADSTAADSAATPVEAALLPHYLAAKLSSDMQQFEGDAVPAARWPAIIAVLCVGLLSAALPDDLQFGPRWLMFAISGALLIPTIITHRINRPDLNQACGYLLNAVMTVALCVSLGLLLSTLPKGHEAPIKLLKSASVLWLTNVLVFSLWYWRLDAGGPHHRDARPGHRDGAFLFPQMTLDGRENWSPDFVDYLFLGFNTSTAFSPTDVLPLSRWAKMLMMVQSMVALLIVAVLAARAINVL